MASLDQIEDGLIRLVERRRAAGGFDVNAEDILILSQSLLALTQWLKSQMLDATP